MMKYAIVLVGLALLVVLIIENDIAQHRLNVSKNLFIEDVSRNVQITVSTVEDIARQIQSGKTKLAELPEGHKESLLAELERLKTDLQNLQNQYVEVEESAQTM